MDYLTSREVDLSCGRVRFNYSSYFSFFVICECNLFYRANSSALNFSSDIRFIWYAWGDDALMRGEFGRECLFGEGNMIYFFEREIFFLVLLFERYTSFLMKGFYAINRCVAMEAFFLVMFSRFSFYISFVFLPCFGNEMLIELFEKFKDNLIMYASFVSAAFMYLLVLFCFLCEFYLFCFLFANFYA